MEPQEIDVALDELENRLDRLRSLYEQYFLGIEKIEPNVARKDVDRRFWILRRTKIRNTARRFRLQVLIQRYNTFQQYWTRICREIENGTYSRHLLKAQKRLGEEPLTIAAKKRFGKRKRAAEEGSPEPAAPGGDAAVPSERNVAAEAQLARAAALASAARRSTRPPSQLPPPESPRPPERSLTPAPSTLPPAAPQQPAARGRVLEALGPLDLDFDDAPPAARPAAPPARPAPTPVRPAPTPVRPAPTPARPAAPAARPAAPAAAPARPAAAAGISDDRLRQVHAELVAARRKLNQGDGVSLDALSKSLRDTEAKLRAQHAGRSVDFQIVLKDGKPVVKPVVRK